MADTLTAAPPTATDAPLDPGAESSTLSDLVGAWDKPAPEGQPEGDEPPEPKPDAKPKIEKTPDAKPDPKPADAKVDGKPAPKLFQAHEALKKTVKTIETERDQLREKIKELEARKPEGPDPKEYENLKSERERLAGELREASYERDAEYRKEYVEKRNNLYREAVGEVVRLSVLTKGTDPATGEPVVTKRPATENDFRKIFKMDEEDQDSAIADMFGPSAARVHRHIDKIRENIAAGNSALKAAREDSDGRTKKMQEQSKQLQETYEKSVKASHQELQEKWPHLFKLPAVDGDNADKELAVAHQSGLDLVASFKSQAGKLSVEDAAAHSAVIEARAAHFPRGQIENRRLREENAALKARLKGKEASDPGAGGDSKPAYGGGEEVTDIEGMAKEWDK